MISAVLKDRDARHPELLEVNGVSLAQAGDLSKVNREALQLLVIA
jgi:hypothetical protein